MKPFCVLADAVWRGTVQDNETRQRKRGNCNSALHIVKRVICENSTSNLTYRSRAESTVRVVVFLVSGRRKARDPVTVQLEFLAIGLVPAEPGGLAAILARRGCAVALGA